MMDHLKVKMKTIWSKKKNGLQSRKKDKPLIEKNNNDMQDGHGYENPMADNAFNITEEHRQRLYRTCEDGYSGPVQPNPEQQDRKSHTSWLTSGFVSEIFPKPPAELDQNLKQHLSDVEKALLEKLRHSFPGEMEGSLTDCCHRQMFDHLRNLLQNISWSTNCLLLMNWVSHTYLSQDTLGNPDQRLLEAWKADANSKLLESLKKEISVCLHKILQTHRNQKCPDDELYIDIIQYVDSKLRGFPETSSDQVREVCFQELLEFVKRYAAEQDELFKEEVQSWKERKEKIETKLFLQTLKTCKELKKYVQHKGDGIQLSVLKETVEVLENLETSTLNLLKEIVADIAERGIKSYFKSGNRYDLQLDTLSTYFPKLSYVSDEQEMVMNEAYKLFAHTYLKHLIRKRCCRRKLRPWMSDDGVKVHGDACYFHSTFSDLAPGVRPWNLMLLEIPEVLASRDIEGLKLTVAGLKQDCVKNGVCSEDLELLPALLRWKGLSKQKAREVLEALPGDPPSGDCASVKTRTSPGSPFLCLICCC